MAHAEPDFLDGSDVDEDNVDQDVENVLLGSDDEESHTPQQFSKAGGAYSGSRTGHIMEDIGHHSEEEEDVLNLVLQGDEEPLDFEGDPGNEGGEIHRVPPVKVRSSVINTVKDHSHGDVGVDSVPSSSHYDESVAGSSGDVSYIERRYNEDDDYEDGDDESETRNTRSRFTSERNVESFNGHHGHGGVSSSSVGIPIQTVGERKVNKPMVQEGRPKHWNHNGPRQAGPRHPGRNPRFQNPPRMGPPFQGDIPPHMRPNMANPPVVQFNDGIFTDFNQPLRHVRPRQPPPCGRFEHPRNPDQNIRHRMQPPNHMHNNMRPNFPPQQQPHNMRPFFPPQENQLGPPRIPGNMPPSQQQHPHPPPPHGPDFMLRGQQRPPRFPPNNLNQRHPRPFMNNPHHMQNPDRPPFPNRPQRPGMRHEFPPHDPMVMNARLQHNQGYPGPHQSNMQPGFMPPPIQQNMGPPRFMGPPGAPPQEQSNPFFMQPPAAGPNFHPPQESVSYQPEGSWGGAPEAMPPPGSNQSPWMQQQQPQQPHPNYNAGGFAPNTMFDQTPRQPNPMMMHANMVSQSHLSVSMQPSHHQLEVPQQIPTSIYIKPNSEIHEALSKGHFRPPPRDEDRRPENSSSSSSRHYDDDRYHDRERSSSRRATSPSSDRRRDYDDYYDDRKSYRHHHDDDRRSRRKYDEDRRDRSGSPAKKISRSERSTDIHERRKEPENKDAEKLLEEAKKMGLGEDYVKKLEEQRKLRERILRTKEERRKQVKGSSTEADSKSNDKDANNDKRSINPSKTALSTNSKLQKGSIEKVIEADSTVATAKTGKPKKILRIVRDKSGKIISKKVHVVIVAKPQQDGQQSTSAS